MQDGHRVSGKPLYPSRSRSEMWRHAHEEEGAPGKAHTMAYINVSLMKESVKFVQCRNDDLIIIYSIESCIGEYA